MAARLTLYGKAGCCLCDEARETICEAIGAASVDLVEVDVSLDPRLARSHGERIPVLELDGREIAELTVDAGRLRALLANLKA